MTDLYSDIHTICDLIDDYCEKAEASEIQYDVRSTREVSQLIRWMLRKLETEGWNSFAAEHCPQLMYDSERELAQEALEEMEQVQKELAHG